MASKRIGREQQSIQQSEPSLHTRLIHNRESILATLALLLGPETDYYVRERATKRLIRLGSEVLPMLLATLNNYPEITTPPWPWWPPQYEHSGYLLTQLSQSAQIPIEALLQHPAVSQPPGPVLWTSVIEAVGLLSHSSYELLLCEGLRAPWMMVRYAAAMALANLAGKVTLLGPTLEELRAHRCEEESIPVQLVVAYALLRQGDSSGIETLIRLLRSEASEEARKAAAFVLTTSFHSPKPCVALPSAQRERLTRSLIVLLQDQNEEVATHAASALGRIASLSALPLLYSLLNSSQPQVQITALTALEEMAGRAIVRRAIRHHALVAHVVGLLRAEEPEVRRQACYTLAACGGEYATAALGMIIFNSDHPGHIEAIEGLRLLHGGLRLPTRTKIVRWLRQALHRPQEEVQVTALDSLSYLLWQARTHNRRKAFHEISNEIMFDGTLSRLLSSPSSWVRQRTVELLSMFDSQLCAFRRQLIQLLRFDNDSGVRACIAYNLGQVGARWAMPALLQALLDTDDSVAETALSSLGRLACPGDSIVVYVVKELATCDPGEHGVNRLAQFARALLKKWRMVAR